MNQARWAVVVTHEAAALRSGQKKMRECGLAADVQLATIMINDD